MSGERLAWWYVDPLDASRARYWDGSGWTEYVASIPAGKVLTPLPPMAPRRTSGAAVAALVSSVLGLGIFGVLFGHAGLQRINRSSGSLTGRGLAGVGMTLGYLEVAAMLVVAGAMLDVHATPRSSTPSCAVITTTGDCAPTPRVVTQADHAVESAEPQPSATISITATSFAPASVTITRGGTVTWHNDDQAVHAIVDASSGQDGASEIQPGATYQHTYSRPGTFIYGDSLHPQSTGTIFVT